MKVYIFQSVYRDMQEEAALYPDKETGGVWLGQLCEDRWIITHNLRPGPQAVHQPGCFAYDHSYVLEQARKCIAAARQPIGILGYWHTHTSGRDTFSAEDGPLNEQYAALRESGALCGIVTNRDGIELALYQVRLPLRYEKTEYIIMEE